MTTRRQLVLFVLKVSVSATLLVLIFRRLGSDAVVDVFHRANPWLLAVGVVAIVGQTGLSTLKWRVLLRQQGTRLPYPMLLRINLVSSFINLFMPSVLGGDAYRTAWLRAHTGGIGGAIPSIVLDRMTGLIALVLMAPIGLTLLFAPTQLWLFAGIALAAGTILYLFATGPLARWLESRPSDAAFGSFHVLASIARGIRPSPTLAYVMAISLLFQFNTVFINWIYSRAIGITVDFVQLMIIVPAVYMVEMLPVSINGIGLREGAFAVLFAKAGLLAEHGILLGLTISVMRYVAGLVGGALLALEFIGGRARRSPAPGMTD